MARHCLFGTLILSVSFLTSACGGVQNSASSSLVRPAHIDAEPRIVTRDEITTESEMARRAEHALLEQRWREAAEAYGTLFLRAIRMDPTRKSMAFHRGLALEGMGDRTLARDTYLDLVRRFSGGRRARAALVRAATLDAYLEDWASLAEIGNTLLSRVDLDDVDRLVGLGARGLAEIEVGDDKAASKDIHDGLDLADQLHYGERDVLPVAVAQLRFALGELRRVRSERIVLDPVPSDFLSKLDERCAGLLDAQAAFAMAVRSVDSHWAAIAGYRVGEMYRALYRDLMLIPPPNTSRTDRQKQVFYAFMHVRYRVLLEKGFREMQQTTALGERMSDSSVWIQRARAAQNEIATALSDEKAQIDKMPFTEEEVKEALTQMEKRSQRARVPMR